MSRRILKKAVLSVALGSLLLAISPTLVANAESPSWSGLDASDPTADRIEPVLPNLPDGGASGPDLVLPQITSTLTSVVPVAPGGNPFAAQPVVAPSAAATPSATSNPFAPTPLNTPGTSIAPDVEPLVLQGPAATAPTTPVPATAISNGVDETALRYYAGQRDLARVGAETRRLKALYPNWEPPADLFTPVSSVDEQPLWDLFAAGQYVAERGKIAELKAANPTWVPSADLLTKLDDAEARQALAIAYRAANWGQVIAVAQSRNSILVCTQIEALWQLGEAFARQRNYASAFDTYKYILANCANPNERLSTVQKAARLLPQPGIDSLVLLGRPLPDGTMEFDSIAFNGVRAQLSAAISDGLLADSVDPNRLERFAAYVRATRQPDDIGLFGWYYYNAEEYQAAYAWFTAGTRVSKDPKFLEGQVLSLRGGEQLEPALKLATAVQTRSPELTKEYVELVAAILTDPDATLTFTDEQLKAFEKTVAKAKSAVGAQAVGWSYLNGGNLSVASAWFNDSIGWGITEGGVIGKAVVASRLKQYGTLSTLKTQYTMKYPGLAKFKIYTVKVKAKKKTSSGSGRVSQVTQSSIDCKDDKHFGLFFAMSCRP